MPKTNKPKTPPVPADDMLSPQAGMTPPARDPDPEIVITAWAVNMWNNRLKNAEKALAEIGKQQGYVYNEIEIIKINLNQQVMRLAAQNSLMSGTPLYTNEGSR